MYMYIHTHTLIDTYIHTYTILPWQPLVFSVQEVVVMVMKHISPLTVPVYSYLPQQNSIVRGSLFTTHTHTHTHTHTPVHHISIY